MGLEIGSSVDEMAVGLSRWVIWCLLELLLRLVVLLLLVLLLRLRVRNPNPKSERIGSGLDRLTRSIDRSIH
jgi:hypothetical protein